MADLYGGKICAALDRQHPRDLFDIRLLLESEGINRDIFDGVIVYLLSHNRPISEVMDRRWKDISGVYNNEFYGMTLDPVGLDELQAIPEKMISTLKYQFAQRDFDFLRSFKTGNPD